MMGKRERIIKKIKESVCEEILKEGGVKYLIGKYECTDTLPTKQEVAQIMFFGEGYYY